MKVLGVDTASAPADRGYALAEDGVLIWSGKQRPPPSIGAHVVAGERPWQKQASKPGARRGWAGRPRPEDTEGGLSGERLITFCVNNGFQLRDAWDYGPEMARPLYVLIPVLTWKDLALPGCSRMAGDAFCNNLRQKYAPEVADTDILDAIGIAIAASRLKLADLKRYVPKGLT
jgi:hypothetical protein